MLGLCKGYARAVLGLCKGCARAMLGQYLISCSKNEVFLCVTSYHCNMQIHGGIGVCQDTPLAHMYVYARCLRIADGPDVVHMESVAKLELKQQLQAKL